MKSLSPGAPSVWWRRITFAMECRQAARNAIALIARQRRHAWIGTIALFCLAGPANADIYVIDGDTIVVDREHIRLVGVDAPEIRHAKCDAELSRGLEAKARLLEMIVDACGPLAKALASCLDIARQPHPDRYGRTLARVSIGGMDLAAQLIGGGHARPYDCPRGHCPRRAPWCAAGRP
ncbi:MAG: hypothetical protein K0R27_280 [Xanthobacteraceae bacterium]|jgi:endonuclease YncB( thermonuclease family)|nr:hypothetical protein [Xanthobacteraceae bacterium]